MEYRDGDYRYQASYAPQPADRGGEHPYAGFSDQGYGDGTSYAAGPLPADYGYGDPGYSDSGYDGPASQDSGIAGTRTVRGYVETHQAPSGYAQQGYPMSAPVAQDYGYSDPRYADGQHIELAYPLPSAGAYPEPDSYQQPWDYGQPLRYDGEAPAYPAPDGYQQPAAYANPDGYGSGGYGAQAYDPADYNGSAHSRPGIDGPGYDLSGIIGTGDFEAVGYDEPSYGRLSYDDPRYDPPAAHDNLPAVRNDVTRFDMPVYDESRLDNLWLPNEGTGPDAEPVGYENDGFGTDGPYRSGYQDSAPALPAAYAGRRRRAGLDETRFDLRADDVRADYTRFDVPAYDETRAENMRALDFRGSATGLLPPPQSEPLNWPDETTIDALVSDLYLDYEPEQEFPAAYVRTLERPDEAQRDTGTQRARRKRRGRTDRRQWMALGAIAVVAAGAIGGVLLKYVFPRNSGPAHSIVVPDTAAGFTRSPNLEKAMKVDAMRENLVKHSSGHLSDAVSAVYSQGSTAPGGNAQIFMFVGGKLSNAAPASSLADFRQANPGAKVVPAGSLGGEASCAVAKANGQSVQVCVWWDNDTYGELMSSTMSTAKLATTLDAVRPSLETVVK